MLKRKDDYSHNLPRVVQKRRFRTIKARLLNRIQFGHSTCWYWVGSCDALGYGRLHAYGENKVHRVAWRVFQGSIPSGMDVLHRCDVRNCVNPDHLFVGTHQDNMQDITRKGRQRYVRLCGEHNPQAKLSRGQVEEMRALRASTGLSYSKIADQFAIASMTAYRAIQGESWS